MVVPVLEPAKWLPAPARPDECPVVVPVVLLPWTVSSSLVPWLEGVSGWFAVRTRSYVQDLLDGLHACSSCLVTEIVLFSSLTEREKAEIYWCAGGVIEGRGKKRIMRDRVTRTLAGGYMKGKVSAEKDLLAAEKTRRRRREGEVSNDDVVCGVSSPVQAG